MKTSDRRFGTAVYLVIRRSEWPRIQGQHLTCGRSTLCPDKHDFAHAYPEYETLGEAIQQLGFKPRVIISEVQVAPKIWRYTHQFGSLKEDEDND